MRLVYRMGSNEYWGVQMTDWEDAPCSRDRSLTRRIGGRGYDLYYNGPKLHMVVLRHAEGALLGRQHAARPALERDDARDRQGPEAARLSEAALATEVAVFGAGYVGLVTGACFADLGHDVVVRDIVAEKIDALRRGEVPIHEPGLDELLERNRERLASRSTSARRSRAPTSSTSRSARRRRYSGDADLSAVWTVVDELPQVERRIVAGDEEHRAGRHRARRCVTGSTSAGSRTSATCRTRSSRPRAPPSATSCSPDRIVIGAFDDADGDVVEELHAGIDAPVVRCDVASAEMIKLAANAALVTRISFINEIANVCEATGADVVDGRRGDRARPPDRPVLPPRRHRLRRFLLSRRTRSRSSSSRRTRATTSSS